jgi:hypothetical protein
MTERSAVSSPDFGPDDTSTLAFGPLMIHMASVRHHDGHGGRRQLSGSAVARAATAAFAQLGELGFQVRERDLGAWRGSEVTVASETVTLLVQADWIDRELVVWVRAAGTQYLPIASLSPESGASLCVCSAASGRSPQPTAAAATWPET